MTEQITRNSQVPQKYSRILLINPPQISEGKFLDGYQGTRPVLPPLGLAYIAAYLEQHGYSVDIFDGMIETASPEEIAQRTTRYDVVGITSITFQVILTYQVLEAIRKQNPSIPIVIGGPHVSSLPLEPLEQGLADFSVIGEGEEPMLRILQALEQGNAGMAIPGVAYRHNKHIYPAQGSGMIADLATLPLPARHLLPMNRYRTSAVRSRHFPAASMITSRGCPMQCTFCFNHLPYRSRIRFLPAQQMVDEMLHLISEYGIREIHFWDDNFLANKARIRDFCDIMETRHLHIPFDCEGIIHSFDPELLTRLQRVGCYSVSYGIESGCQRILDMMQKRITLDQIRKVVADTKKLGLDVRGYFLFGFPTETREEILETIAFAKSLRLSDATFSLLIPLPGTTVYNQVRDEPQFMKHYWQQILLSEISFPKLPLVYHPETVEPEELLELHRTACRAFYFRPSQILAKAWRGVRSIDVFTESIKGLRALIRG